MHVSLVVPDGVGDAEAVADAVRRWHPDATFAAVWAGDPQRRPAPPAGATWIDRDLDPRDLDARDLDGRDPDHHDPDGRDPTGGAGWNRLLVALDPEAYELARGCRAVARLLRTTGEPTVLVRVGALAVAGPLEPLVATAGVTVIERAAGVPPADGLAPTPADLAGHGPYGTAAIGFAADAADVADAIAAALATHPPGFPVGGALAAVVARGATPVTFAPGAVVAGWGQAGRPTLADLGHLDRAEPWHLTFPAATDGAPAGAAAARPARTSLAADAVLAGLLDATRSQWVGGPAVVHLPGGVAVDRAIRNLVAAELERWRRGEADLPPEPFGAAGSALLDWLETPWPPWGPDVGRYWAEVRRLRPELVAAFPHPEGVDHDAFVEWIERSWRFDHRSPLLRSGARGMRPALRDEGREPGGVNVFGYLGSDKSIGDVARRMLACLTAAGVPTAALHYQRSGSPSSADTPELTDRLRYATNLLVVNGDQMPLVAADHGPALLSGRRTIGYWFWELEEIPSWWVLALDHVDELWVATEYSAAAFRAVTRKPVRVVDVPVPPPAASTATRAELGLPDGRFVFLVTFDHLSVTERKNPVGAIEAFRRAFPDPEPGGPVLHVKTFNRSHRWAEHERVRVAAAGRPDIAVVDRHLSRADQMALIGHSDALVSLHRAEGLGLHLMEAMWLGTPTIATRYSGNLHFQDDTTAALVDAALVPVTRGEGYLPESGRWAEPDLDQAAAWMRRLVAEPETAARLAAAGRRRMEQQPDLATAGRRIAELAGVTAPAGR